MKEWKNKMRIMLDSTKGKIGWTDIGCKMLQCMYNLNPSLFKNYKIFEGLDNLYPVNWNNCVTEYTPLCLSLQLALNFSLILFSVFLGKRFRYICWTKKR